jgi:hypothetical protein
MVTEKPPEEQWYSFDEYKLYYESTEKVTDRRLAANTWNYGLCSALIVAISSLGTWAVSRPEFRVGALAAVIVLAGMGALLCSLWIGQIRDFKDLNAAKFEVLASMAPRVRFGKDDDRSSANPFVREWEILKEKHSARQIEAMGIIALRSSNAEFLVPVAFRWLFLLMILRVIAVVVTNWRTIMTNPFEFGGVPRAETVFTPPAPTLVKP